jgi:superfamily II DNA or RNA helicase
MAFDETGLSTRVPGTGVLALTEPDEGPPNADAAWDDPPEDKATLEVSTLGVESDDDLDPVWRRLADRYGIDPESIRRRFGTSVPPPSGSRPSVPRPSPPPPPAPAWRQHLSALGRALGGDSSSGHGTQLPGGAVAPPSAALPPDEVWYAVQTAACLSRGGLVVELFQRSRRRDGEWGLLKPLPVSQRRLAAYPAGEDRELLELLWAVSGRAVAAEASPLWVHEDPTTRHALVPPPLFPSLVPRLAATGRLLVWNGSGARPELERRLDWDPQPWTLGLRLERSENGDLGIVGELTSDGHTRPLSEPEVLLARGLVVFPERIAPFEPRGGFPWVALLRRLKRLELPAADRAEALAQLWELPSLPAIVGPEELLPREEPAPPRPRLRLRRRAERRGYQGPPRLDAELSFRYGDRTVLPGAPGSHVYDRDANRRLPRDREHEAAAEQLLAEHGLKPAPSWGAPGLLLTASRLPAVAERLVAAGWEVEVEDRALRHGGSLQFSVRSGIDWLDLSVVAEVGGQDVALPEILAAIRRGERFVALGDGSHGLLPEEWLERLTSLERLASAGEENVLHFAPTQALLLDALLADAPAVDADAAFDALRQRLLKPAAARAAHEPRGFRGELRPYQRQGLGWLRSLAGAGLGGCLADDMGLGKTVQVLALLQWRRQRPAPAADKRPSLVVAPRSVVFNWIEEAERFAPRLRVADFSGAGRAELLPVLGEHDLVVTTYGVVRREAARLAKTPFDYVVLDEAQMVKNPATLTAKAVRLLRAEHRLALTGTPVENHLGELWALLDFLNPGLLGKLARVRKSAPDASLSDRDLGAVATAVRPFLLRRRKEEVLTELPTKSEQTLWCELGAKQRRIYDELSRHYRQAVSERVRDVGVARSHMLVLEALLRLRQAACHPALIDPERASAGSAKIDLLLEQLAELVEEGHKALVFSQFTSLLDLVGARLDHAGISWEQLDGRTRNRKKKVERFQQDPGCPVFLISLKAGGTGLNLTAAHYVFLLDPWWNPAVEAQAIDRAHRIGQQRPVFAYRLIARDTVEEKILQLQQQKRRVADAILAADAAPLRGLTAAEVDRLLS